MTRALSRRSLFGLLAGAPAAAVLPARAAPPVVLEVALDEAALRRALVDHISTVLAKSWPIQSLSGLAAAARGSPCFVHEGEAQLRPRAPVLAHVLSLAEPAPFVGTNVHQREPLHGRRLHGAISEPCDGTRPVPPAGGDSPAVGLHGVPRESETTRRLPSQVGPQPAVIGQGQGA